MKLTKISKRLMATALAAIIVINCFPTFNVFAENDEYSWAIPAEFEYAEPFSDGLAAVKKDGKWGFIDKTGKLVIPYQFDESVVYEAPYFSEGLAVIADNNGKSGFIDKTGKNVIPYQFDQAENFSDGLALVERYDETLMCNDGANDTELGHEHPTDFYGFINKTGEMVIPQKYIYAESFSEGLALVSSDGNTYGFIDTTGKIVIPETIQSRGLSFMMSVEQKPASFSDGLAAIRTDNGDSYIDKTGKTVISTGKYYSGLLTDLNFHEGLALSSNGNNNYENEKYGFIDKTGKLVIPYKFNYDEISNYERNFFSEGLLAVSTGGYENTKYGFIDKKGETVIPYKFDSASNFSEGLACVSVNGKYGYIKINKLPTYSLPELISTGKLSESEINEISTSASEKIKTGEACAIYELAEGEYYVVFAKDGDFTGGAIVKAVIENGKKTYKTVDYSQNELTEDYFNDYLKKDKSTSNITLKYSDIGSSKSKKDYVATLTEALKNINGLSVNDLAKSDIADYIESSLRDSGIATLPTKKDKIVIDYKSIKPNVDSILSLEKDFNKVLDENDISLNRELKVDLRVDSQNVDFEKGIVVNFKEDLKDIPDEITSIVVLLGDNSHSIKIDTQTLKSLIKKYGDFYVTMRKIDTNTYQIQYLDSDKNLLEELKKAMYFTLPAENSLSTIFANYKDNTDNWGGRYDENNKSIEFMTKYSGNYEVLNNTIEINDISDLAEKTQNAIKYMVSKEYFDVIDGLFRPDELLTRYDFSKALVKMFYALDRQTESNFTDVEKDNDYYPYVSSGVESDIIKGYEDNTFRGDKNLTNNEAVAFCARTLAEKTGYIYPENPDEYLNFKDNDSIADWAKNDIALAVREGLIEDTEYFNGNEEITRAQSAQLLYNLFMLLNKPPTETYEINETENSGNNNNIIIIGGIFACIVLVGAGVVVSKKKKTDK